MRRRPEDTLGDHLEFALKREGVDLSVLNALFQVVEPDGIKDLVRATPTGKYTRRIWFLYEWLTGERLDLPDAGKVRAVPAADPELQVTLADGQL